VLTVLVAHSGRPLAPHEAWTAWGSDPLVAVGLLLLSWLYWRGRPRTTGAGQWQPRAFAAAMVVVALALLSPLDAVSQVLASAHMVQHLLLTVVAAPLLALSAPGGALLRGAPTAVRTAVPPLRRRLPLLVGAGHALRNPSVVWLLHVGALWTWHAAALYDAALGSPVVHALEHSTFLVTAVLLWRVVIGARAVRVSPGLGVLLVFALTLQSALLALLLTFAQTPWYSGYTTTTRAWGLEQLADQHLAGAIMWVPAGLVYLGTALALLVGWVRGTADPSDVPTTGAVPPPAVALTRGR
jgi:putative membrane protein